MCQPMRNVYPVQGWPVPFTLVQLILILSYLDPQRLSSRELCNISALAQSLDIRGH